MDSIEHSTPISAAKCSENTSSTIEVTMIDSDSSSSSKGHRTTSESDDNSDSIQFVASFTSPKQTNVRTRKPTKSKSEQSDEPMVSSISKRSEIHTQSSAVELLAQKFQNIYGSCDNKQKTALIQENVAESECQIVGTTSKGYSCTHSAIATCSATGRYSSVVPSVTTMDDSARPGPLDRYRTTSESEEDLDSSTLPIGRSKISSSPNQMSLLTRRTPTSPISTISVIAQSADISLSFNSTKPIAIPSTSKHSDTTNSEVNSDESASPIGRITRSNTRKLKGSIETPIKVHTRKPDVEVAEIVMANSVDMCSSSREDAAADSAPPVPALSQKTAPISVSSYEECESADHSPAVSVIQYAMALQSKGWSLSSRKEDICNNRCLNTESVASTTAEKRPRGRPRGSTKTPQNANKVSKKELQTNPEEDSPGSESSEEPDAPVKDEEPLELISLESPVEHNHKIIWKIKDEYGYGPEGMAKAAEFRKSAVWLFNRALQREVDAQQKLVEKIVHRLVNKVPLAFRTQAVINRFYNAVIGNLQKSGKFKPFDEGELEDKSSELTLDEATAEIQRRVFSLRQAIAQASSSSQSISNVTPALQSCVDEQLSTFCEILADQDPTEVLQLLEAAKSQGTEFTVFSKGATVTIKGRYFGQVDLTLITRYPSI